MKESGKWLTILSELKMDNVLLKNRLSKAISGKVPSGFVEQAELFQQQFVDKDQVIDLLRRDVILLQEEIYRKGMTEANSIQHAVLGKAAKQLQFEFQKMKSSFIKVLNEHHFN
ncbi:hypothetical protein LL912_02535 [Niabella sp. CC-SYL272]|uniref:hypothetical protein n=1 Tax=Niabella agricola TaxID=2891571 RepID=UPI001F22DB8B|nr:hypothetical protein [Niabella agricola]MCF3107648.1 hypothetical protein [Niabella agricola]